jgi:hypothetical protein
MKVKSPLDRVFGAGTETGTELSDSQHHFNASIKA